MSNKVDLSTPKNSTPNLSTPKNSTAAATSTYTIDCQKAVPACALHNVNGGCMDRIRLFAGLPLAAKRQLLARATHATYPAGSILVQKGDPIESILIIRKGRIKTFRLDADGEEYVLDVLHDGQALWHGMFLEDQIYHYSVACLTKVELCRIHRADFEELLAGHPDVAMGLIRMVCTELNDAEEKLMILGIRDPRRRLAEYLIHRDARCMGEEIRLKLDDIAFSVGLRTETVSRVLSAFEREGLIERLGRGRLAVRNRAGLLQVINE